ncbi:hypothetical protein C8Q79DRAFT_1005869 [Trametes meyenii]|nr:hypothetical protein C8Q79DRAFT_1005869 [Trametes meyenii]
MVFVLRRKDFEVFESLFRIDGAARRELDWEDFRQAFEWLDFKQCNGHGSARYFKALGKSPRRPFHWHRPHNGIITTDAQGRMQKKMEGLYEWTESSFCEKTAGDEGV